MLMLLALYHFEFSKYKTEGRNGKHC